jgi:hypothetical protein
MMSVQPVDPRVAQFIRDHISSVSQLELLLLIRTNTQRRWEVEELSRELRIDSAWTLSQLTEFVKHGLLERDEPTGRFYFHPRTEELDMAVTTVAQAYLLHRVSIVEMIFSDTSSKPIRAFADAFRLRKGPPDG